MTDRIDTSILANIDQLECSWRDIIEKYGMQELEIMLTESYELAYFSEEIGKEIGQAAMYSIACEMRRRIEGNIE